MGYCDKHKETTHFKFLIKPRSLCEPILPGTHLQTCFSFFKPTVTLKSPYWVSEQLFGFLHSCISHILCDCMLEMELCRQTLAFKALLYHIQIALWVWPCILCHWSLLFCAFIKWGNNGITLQSRNSQMQYYSNTTDIGGQIIGCVTYALWDVWQHP